MTATGKLGSQVALQASADRVSLPAIQVLPPYVVERIAAGEVVERPVSVVRELVDNALDAGAQEIRIDIRGGGLRSIRVADDGTGIEADQVELAVRHHATSKIRVADDLLQTGSLGFRGEALPSIAAVSSITILTAASRAPALLVEYRQGHMTERRPATRPRGTTVTVSDLFANAQPRLKFLTNVRAESAQIHTAVRRYALANPHVTFHLILDGHAAMRTSGLGMEHALGEVFGPALASSMVPFGPVHVAAAEWTGYISAAHVTRSNRQHISLMVNGRCVGSRRLLSVFEDGYRHLLPRGRHPIAVLALSVPRNTVDINVHPSKAEVRLEHEAVLGSALTESTRALLGRNAPRPGESVDFSVGPHQDEFPHLLAERGPAWNPAPDLNLRAMTVTGQVRRSLIVLEGSTGIYLVDQHRAHERAIYGLLMRRRVEERAGQLLLEPLLIELTRTQIERLEPRLAELTALGFDCEWFGGKSFLVRSIPVVPETADLAGVIDDLVEMSSSDESDWQHRLLTSLACRTATRRGKPLTLAQCSDLIELLADTAAPAVCPHGAPIIVHFDSQFLERQFRW